MRKDKRMWTHWKMECWQLKGNGDQTVEYQNATMIIWPDWEFILLCCERSNYSLVFLLYHLPRYRERNIYGPHIWTWDTIGGPPLRRHHRTDQWNKDTFSSYQPWNNPQLEKHSTAEPRIKTRDLFIRNNEITTEPRDRRERDNFFVKIYFVQSVYDMWQKSNETV